MTQNTPIDLTSWQKASLASLTDPKATPIFHDTWNLAQATLVHPRLDLRRFKRAVDQLIARHDVLRLRFHRGDDGFSASFAPTQKIEIEMFDIGDIADDAEFQARIYKIAREPMPLFDTSLVSARVVQCGARGDVIVMRIHHLITDGHGMIVLIEDLLKFLLGMPIAEPAMDHATYAKRWSRMARRKQKLADDFWAEKLAKMQAAPMVGARLKNLPMVTDYGHVGESRHIKNWITTASAARLRNKMAALNVSLSTALFAAFADAVCAEYGVDEIWLNTPVGRTEPALFNYAGEHTYDMLMQYQAHANADFWDRVAALRVQYLEGLEHLPADAALRGTQIEQDLVARGCFPRQFMTRAARARNRERASPFASGFDDGPGAQTQVGPFTLTKLNVNVDIGSIAELQLNDLSTNENIFFTVGFHTRSYTVDEAQTLVDRMLATLEIELDRSELQEPKGG